MLSLWGCLDSTDNNKGHGENVVVWRTLKRHIDINDNTYADAVPAFMIPSFDGAIGLRAVV